MNLNAVVKWGNPLVFMDCKQFVGGTKAIGQTNQIYNQRQKCKEREMANRRQIKSEKIYLAEKRQCQRRWLAINR